MNRLLARLLAWLVNYEPFTLDQAALDAEIERSSRD